MIEEIADIRFEITVHPSFVRNDEIMELYGNHDRLDSVIGHIEAPDLRENLSWMLDVSRRCWSRYRRTPYRHTGTVLADILAHCTIAYNQTPQIARYHIFQSRPLLVNPV